VLPYATTASDDARIAGPRPPNAASMIAIAGITRTVRFVRVLVKSQLRAKSSV